MVLPDSHQMSRVLWYSGSVLGSAFISLTGLSPSLAVHSFTFCYGRFSLYARPTTPHALRPMVWAIPVSLAATSRITDLFSFPTGTKMFQFPAFARHRLCIHLCVLLKKGGGCPIRKSPDQSLLGGSPRLIAACRVLLRFPIPRHPPRALNLLVQSFHSSCCNISLMKFSKI